MALRNLTMIISGAGLVTTAAWPDDGAPRRVPVRLQLVADALSGAAPGSVAAPASGLSVARTTDPTDPAALSGRRAALVAAMQEWSGVTSATLRTSALAVLAASRVATLPQEATGAPRHQDEETVFEAFFRGVQGHSSPDLLTGRGGRR